MNPPLISVTVDAIAAFAERIDTRTPAEFAEDRLPAAANHPVLSNEERAQVGTIYKQESSFAAKKIGAALVSRNIARMLETVFADKPREWQPLVYCWRGGTRSAALVHVLNQIGWKARQLEGGYKAYRRRVLRQLDSVPGRFSYRVICGLTGSGKSRLLQALNAQGAQTLDLEGLAAHRGSLLGGLPEAPQPSQKLFESQIVAALERFDPARPVFVESESRRLGALGLPETLVAAMWASPCVGIELALSDRIALLKDEYGHFLADPQDLILKLEPLLPLHGRKVLDNWFAAARSGDWDVLVADLLERHYDPAYARSMRSHFPRFPSADSIRLRSHDAREFERAAREMIGASTAIEVGGR
jgi:tRNA 2-selenouridine synthase